jgi:DNA-binding NarL/FixJ family response regulator
MLDRRRILIADDQSIIAHELSNAVEAAAGEVIGPVARVRDGLDLIGREEIDAAILDVGLVDRDVVPMAASLLRRNKTVVFHTASALAAEIVDRFGPPALCPKPMRSEQVVACLTRLLALDVR